MDTVKLKLASLPWSRLSLKVGAFSALFLAHIIWGANFVVAKITLEEIPLMSLGFLRFALASILLIPFLWFQRDGLTVRWKDIPNIFLVGILMITLHIYLFYAGLARTSALNASVLSLIVPIVSVFIGWIILKEKVYWINLLGTILGVLGGLSILGIPLIFTAGFSMQNLTGNTLVLMSGIVFVLGALISKPLLKKYHYLTLTICIFMVGTLTFLIPAVLEFLQNPQWIIKVSILGWVGLLYITVLSTISAFFLFQWGLERVDISKATIGGYIQPIISASLAVPFLNERVSFSFVIGTCLIFLGVYWGTLGKEQHHHPQLKHHHR